MFGKKEEKEEIKTIEVKGIEKEDYVFYLCDTPQKWKKVCVEYIDKGFVFSIPITKEKLNFFWETYREKTNLVVNIKKKKMYLQGGLV